jgi:hypothetical protein
MTTYRISYRQTEYRHCEIETDSESGARQAFEDGSYTIDDEFDMAEDTAILGIEEVR